MKLLVATEFAPNAAGGGPAVVRQMLRDWPAGELYWWSCHTELNQHFGQNVAKHFCAALPCRLRPHRQFTRIKAALLENWWAPRAAGHLAGTLKQVQPDRVWAIPHDWSALPMARVLPNGEIPFHTTMQDFIDAHGHPAKFGAARCRRMVESSMLLYAKAATRDATSHPMVDELRDTTGMDAAQVLHAGLESEDFTFLEKKIEPTASTLRVAYAGTILVEPEFSLFVSVVEELRAQLPVRVELHLFGAHSYANRPWFDPRWIHEHGNLPEQDLLQRLRECHWGFAPMAIHDSDPRYNRFSFPTKFIIYLSAGLPIITLGHPESSVMKMAHAYRTGPCCSDGADLKRKLSKAFALASPRENYRQEIMRCARAEFDAARMRSVLYRCLGR